MSTINLTGNSGSGAGPTGGGGGSSPTEGANAGGGKLSGLEYLQKQYDAQQKSIAALAEKTKADTSVTSATKTEIQAIWKSISALNSKTAANLESAAAIRQQTAEGKKAVREAAATKRKDDVAQKKAEAGWEKIRKQRERQAAIAARDNDPNTYRIQNASRLGLRGMRAADTGSWVELHRSQRELDRIERHHGDNPGVAAAIKQARMRIAVGKESQSPGRLAVGEGIGAMADFMANPEVALAVAGITAIAGAPLVGAAISNKLTGMSRPFQNMRSGFMDIGRSSGLVGGDLQSTMYANGQSTPQWMKDLGIGPQDGADLLKRYGIGVRTKGDALNILQAVGGAEYSPYLGGLGKERYADMANFGRTTGIADGSVSGWNDYFRKYQQVSIVAQAQGLDKSKAISNIEGLLKQATSAGGGGLGNGDSIFRLWKTLSTSGNASMRSGEGVSRVLGGFQAAADQIGFGGGTPQNLAVSNFISSSGGPGAFKKGGKGWASLFGSQKAADDFAAANPDFMDKVYTAADQGPGMLSNAIGDVIKQKSTLMDNIGRYAPAARLGGYAGSLAEANARGSNVFDLTTQRGAEALNSPPAKALYDMIRKKGWSKGAAAGLVANAFEESGYNPKSQNRKSGNYGIFQWDANRRRKFKEVMGKDIHGSTMQEQVDFMDWELHNTHAAVGRGLSVDINGDQAGAMVSTNYEIPSKTAAGLVSAARTRGALGGRIEAARAADIDGPNAASLMYIGSKNRPSDWNAAQANNQVTGLLASEYASSAALPLVNAGSDAFKGFSDSFISFVGGVKGASEELAKLAKSTAAARQEMDNISGNHPSGMRPRSIDPGNPGISSSLLPAWLQPDWGPRKQ